MPIIVVATAQPKPGKVEEVAAVYAEAATRVHEEPGCELYAIHTTKEQVVLVEKWESGEALRAHAEGDNVKATRAALEALIEAPTEAVVLRPFGEATGKGAV